MALRVDPVVLRELYVRREWSMSQIARHYECHLSAVHRALRRHQIPTRPRGGTSPVPFDPVVLRELYVRREWSMSQIARHYHCASSAVHRALRRYQIPTRPPTTVDPVRRQHRQVRGSAGRVMGRVAEVAAQAQRVPTSVQPADGQVPGRMSSGETVIDLQLCRDFRAGAAIGHLVAEYGVSQVTVLRALMRGGVVSGRV